MDAERIKLHVHMFEKYAFTNYKSLKCSNRITCSRCRTVNEELHNLYSSPNIIRMIKSRSMREIGNVARIGEEEECI
jgi:hypothetical protein